MRPGRKLRRFVDRLEVELSGRMKLPGGLNEAVTIYGAADRRGSEGSGSRACVKGYAVDDATAGDRVPLREQWCLKFLYAHLSKQILRSQNHKMTVPFGAAPSKLSVSE